METRQQSYLNKRRFAIRKDRTGIRSHNSINFSKYLSSLLSNMNICMFQSQQNKGRQAILEKDSKRRAEKEKKNDERQGGKRVLLAHSIKEEKISANFFGTK